MRTQTIEEGDSGSVKLVPTIKSRFYRLAQPEYALRIKYYFMFSLFKSDPVKKLKKKKSQLLEEAMQVQRSGDLKLYAKKMEAIEELEREIQKLQGTDE